MHILQLSIKNTRVNTHFRIMVFQNPKMNLNFTEGTASTVEL